MVRVCVLGLACLVMGLSATHAEETRYVTDELEATVRAGQGTEYRILRIIPSGTPVKILEQTPDGYVRVELRDGKTGWMLSRYLSEVPIARARLADTEKQLAQLTEENARLTDEQRLLAQSEQQAEQALRRLEEKQTKLKAELSELSNLAARPRELESNNRALQQRLAALEAQAQELRRTNESLRTGEQQAWFVTGAGVLLGGILLGIVAPRIRWRKKPSWETF